MKARISVLTDHADLQRAVMDAVAGAIYAAGEELDKRVPGTPSGACRTLICEGVIVNLLAYLAVSGSEKDIRGLATRLAEAAELGLGEGRFEKVKREDT